MHGQKNVKLLLLVSDMLQNECILATNQRYNMELDQLVISSRLFSQKLTVPQPAKKCSAFSANKMSQVVFLTSEQ